MSSQVGGIRGGRRSNNSVRTQVFRHKSMDFVHLVEIRRKKPKFLLGVHRLAMWQALEAVLVGEAREDVLMHKSLEVVLLCPTDVPLPSAWRSGARQSSLDQSRSPSSTNADHFRPLVKHASVSAMLPQKKVLEEV